MALGDNSMGGADSSTSSKEYILPPEQNTEDGFTSAPCSFKYQTALMKPMLLGCDAPRREEVYFLLVVKLKDERDGALI